MGLDNAALGVALSSRLAPHSDTTWMKQSRKNSKKYAEKRKTPRWQLGRLRCTWFMYKKCHR